MMTIPALLLALIILAVIVFKLVDGVARAGDTHEALDVEAELAKLDELTRQRALLIHELKEAELDQEMGKISLEDHDRIKRRLQRDWLRIDDEIQAIGGSQEVYLKEVEATLKERLAMLEPEEGVRRRPERILCAACSAANAPGASHCKSCQAPLSLLAPLRATPTMAQEPRPRR
jgi:hypothetical protein